MTEFVCVTCGTQYPPSGAAPEACTICSDERQYTGFDGQRWTTLAALRGSHANEFFELEPGLTAIRTKPAFAIHQRALLVQTDQGNILWDCVALLDDATRQFIHQRGGLRAIAISHPHYYTTMNEWARAFHVPVYLHSADRPWAVHPPGSVQFWAGETHDLAGCTLIRCGGHFAGGAVLHWPSGAGGKGALLTGDIIQVVPDRRWVSFMYSYPNFIPLNGASVRQIVAAVEPYAFDRIYGAFHPLQVMSDGKATVARSADRYLRAIAG